jgi:DNA uptake protein ComE-like DNA-binding protein
MAREEGIIRSTGGQAVLWTRSQRRTLLVLVLIFAIVLSIQAIRNRQHVPNPQPAQSPLAHQLADRIDPNTASAAELVVLPQLGDKRAAEIIGFRERYLRRHPGGVPFSRLEDLMQVKGFGPAMIETLRPHLTFPTTAPAAHIMPSQ